MSISCNPLLPFRPLHILPLGFIFFLNIEVLRNIMFQTFTKSLTRSIVNSINTESMNLITNAITTVLESSMESI